MAGLSVFGHFPLGMAQGKPLTVVLRDGDDVRRSDNVRLLEAHGAFGGRGDNLAARDPEGDTARGKLMRHVLDEEPPTGETFLRAGDGHLIDRIRHETLLCPGACAEFSPFALDDHLLGPGEGIGVGESDLERLSGAAECAFGRVNDRGLSQTAEIREEHLFAPHLNILEEFVGYPDDLCRVEQAMHEICRGVRFSGDVDESLDAGERVEFRVVRVGQFHDDALELRRCGVGEFDDEF